MAELLDDGFETTGGPKSRHGCVTAWLILMIVGGVFSTLAYLVMGEVMNETLAQTNPGIEISQTTMILMGILGLVNIAAAVLLFKYKKIGFYIFCGTALLALVLNLTMGLSVVQSLMGLIGIAILYGILQIKDKDITAWEHLD